MAGPGGTEVGRISIRVVPDTSHLADDLRADLAKIEATSKINIGVELDAGGLVEHAKAAVEEASAAAGDIHLDLDTDGLNEKAKAAVKEAQAAAGDIKVGVDVKGKGLQTAEQGLSGLVVAAVALGPALIPIGAALVAAFFPLLGIIAAASLGIGGIAAVAIPQIQGIAKARKEAAAAEKAFNDATTATDRAKALKDEAAAWAQLSPAQLAVSKAFDSLKSAFSAFQNALAPAVLPLFIKGMDMLAAALPALEPIVRNAARAFSGLLDQLGAFGTSKAGQQMINFFTRQVGPAITTLGLVFGNVFAGIGGLLRGFGPLIKPIETALIGATASFAKFGSTAGSNKGFQNFLAYLQQVGPQVIAFLGAFGTAIGHLVSALAPLGGTILVGVTAVLNVFNKIPTAVVGALATAIITVVVAVKAWTIAQAALDLVLTANPIGLIVVAIAGLVAGLIYAYKNSDTFREIVTTAFNAVKAAAEFAFNFIKDHWKLLLPILLGPIGIAVALILNHWDDIKTGTMVLWNAISGFVSSAWIKIKAVVSIGVDEVKDDIDHLHDIVTEVKNIFELVKTSISDKLGDAIDFVKSVPGKITGALGDLGSLLYNAGQKIIQGLIDGILSKIGDVTGAIGKVAGTVASHLPGSPVKEGPLKVLNNGYAGGQISKMLADGITAQAGLARNAMGGLGALGVSGLASGAVAGGNTITVNEARGEPTPNAVLRALAMAEALNFSPA